MLITPPTPQPDPTQGILTYDGSFDGLLTCVFEVFEHRLFHSRIQPASDPLLSLFGMVRHVETQPEKATRVWKGLKAKGGRKVQHDVFCVFLSELPNREEIVLGYTQYLFGTTRKVYNDFSNLYVLQVAQTERKVHREKHRMEAFIRFRLTKDNIYFATIAPDFNVLPLLISHFKDRYADQQWIIYDTKRNAGLYYNLLEVEDITISFNEKFENSSNLMFDEKEAIYQELWKGYFAATNIVARKNLKLHIQHVPRRYWKYLIEKQ